MVNNKRSGVFSKDLVHPQEVEVFYIIPSIRKYLTLFFKDSGKSQKEIAKLLRIRESTVSQYVNDKRANIELSFDVQGFIRSLVPKINNHLDLVNNVQLILKRIRDSGEICRIHMMVSKVPEGCSGLACGNNSCCGGL